MLEAVVGQFVWHCGYVPKEMGRILCVYGQSARIRLLSGPDKGSEISAPMDMLEPCQPHMTPEVLEKLRQGERLNEVFQKLNRS